VVVNQVRRGPCPVIRASRSRARSSAFAGRRVRTFLPADRRHRRARSPPAGRCRGGAGSRCGRACGRCRRTGAGAEPPRGGGAARAAGG
jgi:hypothetical protein